MNNAVPVDGRPLFFAWTGFAVSLCFLLCAIFFGIYAGSAMFGGTALVFGFAVAYSLLAVGQSQFQKRLSLEEESAEEPSSRFGHGELFADSADDAVQLARRINRLYLTYATPVLALLAATLLGFLAVVYWRRWSLGPGAVTLADPLRYAVLSLGLFVIAILVGSYYVGKSRENLFRWLRPVGAVLLLGGCFFLVCGIGLLIIQWRPENLVWDFYLGRGLLAAVMVLSAEAILAVVVDFYRPRTPGEELKPAYESRLLTLFTEPGGIARNIALSLDYQFGFEVSEARFYRFLERTVVPFVVFMAVGMWLMTCVVIVDTDEGGIRERFGRVVAGREQALPPGLYFKLPLPFERIRTYQTAKMQTIPIGYVPAEEGTDIYMEGVEAGDPTGRVIVWSRAHNIEETNFVMAAGPDSDLADDDAMEPWIPEDGPRPVPVYFMAASIPLYYRVDDLYTYMYRHSDARGKLEKLATREVVAYMASVDFFELLNERRWESAEIMHQRIQEAAQGLGVEIVAVGLEGLHPPVQVGSAFDNVVSASEEKHTEVLRAEQYAIRRRPESRSEAFRVRAEAEMHRLSRVGLAQAEGERFMQQLAAFQMSPEFYPLRVFLDLWETETTDIRKYIVGLPGAAQVMILNLEEKLRPDLLDIDLDAAAE